MWLYLDNWFDDRRKSGQILPIVNQVRSLHYNVLVRHISSSTINLPVIKVIELLTWYAIFLPLPLYIWNDAATVFSLPPIYRLFLRTGRCPPSDIFRRRRRKRHLISCRDRLKSSSSFLSESIDFSANSGSESCNIIYFLLVFNSSLTVKRGRCWPRGQKGELIDRNAKKETQSKSNSFLFLLISISCRDVAVS